MRRRRLLLGTAVFCVVLALLGLRFLAAPAFISSPDTLHVVVTDIQLPAGNETVIFDHQYSHQAGAIYEQLVSGGPLPTGAACPASSSQQPYYHYDLTFFHLGVEVATATSDAMGCQDFTVTYPDGSISYFSWLGRDHVCFWVRLHQSVDAPEPIGIFMTMPLCHS